MYVPGPLDGHEWGIGCEVIQLSSHAPSAFEGRDIVFRLVTGLCQLCLVKVDSRLYTQADFLAKV